MNPDFIGVTEESSTQGGSSLIGLLTQDLKPDAAQVIEQAIIVGKIATWQIVNILPNQVINDRAKMTRIMSSIAQILRQVKVVVVVEDAPLKQPGILKEKSQPKRVNELSKALGLDENSTEETNPIKTLEASKGLDIPLVLDTGVTDDQTPNLENVNLPEDDLVQRYVSEIRKYPILPHEKILELSRKEKQGDTEAFKLIVIHNLRMVPGIVKRYLGRGLDLSDLIQEGNMGLMRAVELFDPEKGFHLTTYAMNWIRQFARRAIMDQGRTIRLPCHVNEKIARLEKIKTILLHELGRTPTKDEIAQKAKDLQGLDEIMRAIEITVSSLNTPISGDDGKESEIGELIEDSETLSPSDQVIIHEEMQIAREQIRKLVAVVHSLVPQERNRGIFFMYHQLNGEDEEETLESIGQKIGLTREAIRQINKAIWEKIAEFAESNELTIASYEQLVAEQARITHFEKLSGHNGQVNVDQNTASEILESIQKKMVVSSYPHSQVVVEDKKFSVPEWIQENKVAHEHGFEMAKEIIRLVAIESKIPLESISAKGRPTEITRPRQICSFLLIEDFGLSTPVIGNSINRDHSTVLHAYSKVKNLLEREDPYTTELISNIQSKYTPWLQTFLKTK